MNVKDWMVRIRSQGFCYLYYKKKREIKRREQWGLLYISLGFKKKENVNRVLVGRWVAKERGSEKTMYSLV